tara:strand:+ start:6231 stop:6491 length:261 start_codon:yes stop_codon:yes gene_type:complete
MTKSYDNLIRIKKSGIKEFGLYSWWRYETYKLCTETEQEKYVKLYPEDKEHLDNSRSSRVSHDKARSNITKGDIRHTYSPAGWRYH